MNENKHLLFDREFRHWLDSSELEMYYSKDPWLLTIVKMNGYERDRILRLTMGIDVEWENLESIEVEE